MTRRRPRTRPTLKERLAATLLQMRRWDDHQAEFVRIISHEEAKRMTADEIIARYDFHHDPIPASWDGGNVPWNLTPLPRAEHREITAQIDIPRIAKDKRIRRATAEHVNRLLAKDRGEPKPQSRWPKRKLQSRGFERRI